MHIIKGFFSKIFATKTQNKQAVENQDDEILREAARNAVLGAFQKEEKQNCPQPEQNHTQNQSCVSHEIGTHKHPIKPEVLKIIEEYNEFFFRAFRVPKTHYKLKFDQKNIIVQVNDKDFEAALSKSDKLSICYEHILLRIIQKEVKNFDYRLFLRAGNSAKQHHNYLTGIANKLAAKVTQTGNKVTILSKSSYERSVIHGVIEKLPGVSSKSTGPYHQRRLVIYPEKNLQTPHE